MSKSTAVTYKGTEYRYTVKAVLSPMAFRARAYLPSGAAISGFGNTKSDAIETMTRKINGYIDLCGESGWGQRQPWSFVVERNAETPS